MRHIRKHLKHNRNIVSLLILTILLVAVPLTAYLAQQKQETRSRAATESFSLSASPSSFTVPGSVNLSVSASVSGEDLTQVVIFVERAGSGQRSQVATISCPSSTCNGSRSDTYNVSDAGQWTYTMDVYYIDANTGQEALWCGGGQFDGNFCGRAVTVTAIAAPSCISQGVACLQGGTPCCSGTSCQASGGVFQCLPPQSCNVSINTTTLLPPPPNTNMTIAIFGNNTSDDWNNVSLLDNNVPQSCQGSMPSSFNCTVNTGAAGSSHNLTFKKHVINGTPFQCNIQSSTPPGLASFTTAAPSCISQGNLCTGSSVCCSGLVCRQTVFGENRCDTPINSPTPSGGNPSVTGLTITPSSGLTGATGFNVTATGTGGVIVYIHGTATPNVGDEVVAAVYNPENIATNKYYAIASGNNIASGTFTAPTVPGRYYFVAKAYNINGECQWDGRLYNVLTPIGTCNNILNGTPRPFVTSFPRVDTITTAPASSGCASPPCRTISVAGGAAQYWVYIHKGLPDPLNISATNPLYDPNNIADNTFYLLGPVDLGSFPISDPKVPGTYYIVADAHSQAGSTIINSHQEPAWGQFDRVCAWNKKVYKPPPGTPDGTNTCTNNSPSAAFIVAGGSPTVTLSPTVTPTVPPGSTATPTIPPGSTATPTVPPGSTATPTIPPGTSPTHYKIANVANPAGCQVGLDAIPNSSLVPFTPAAGQNFIIRDWPLIDNVAGLKTVCVQFYANGVPLGAAFSGQITLTATGVTGSPTATLTPSSTPTVTPGGPTATSTPTVTPGGPTSTLTPTPTTGFATPTPTTGFGTPTPTTTGGISPTSTPGPTFGPNATGLFVSLNFEGFTGTYVPKRPLEPITIDIISDSGALREVTGSVIYSSTTRHFDGLVNLGDTVASGVYKVFIKATSFLRKDFGTLLIRGNAVNFLPFTLDKVLLSCDLNNDNIVNILDIGQVYTDIKKGVVPDSLADIDRDGDIDIFDHNFCVQNFLKEGAILP